MTSRDSPSLRQQPFPAAGGMPSHQLPFSEVSCGPSSLQVSLLKAQLKKELRRSSAPVSPPSGSPEQ